MTVTREEADAVLAWCASPAWTGYESPPPPADVEGLARTVVALYQCRDRLRDGWNAGVRWVHARQEFDHIWKRHRDGGQVDVEPMTPEQIEVMSA